jgi:hypothetical protein
MGALSFPRRSGYACPCSFHHCIGRVDGGHDDRNALEAFPWRPFGVWWNTSCAARGEVYPSASFIACLLGHSPGVVNEGSWETGALGASLDLLAVLTLSLRCAATNRDGVRVPARTPEGPGADIVDKTAIRGASRAEATGLMGLGNPGGYSESVQAGGVGGPGQPRYAPQPNGFSTVLLGNAGEEA